MVSLPETNSGGYTKELHINISGHTTTYEIKNWGKAITKKGEEGGSVSMDGFSVFFWPHAK